jgi:hypothetical protein
MIDLLSPIAVIIGWPLAMFIALLGLSMLLSAHSETLGGGVFVFGTAAIIGFGLWNCIVTTSNASCTNVNAGTVETFFSTIGVLKCVLDIAWPELLVLVFMLGIPTTTKED